MICLAKIVVDRLWDPDDAYAAANFLPVGGELCHGIHRIVSPDIEKRFDMVGFKLVKDKDIGRIVIHIVGKLIAARAKIHGRGRYKPREILRVFVYQIGQIDQFII